MRVAFWSPVHGQTTTTGNAVAVSTILALEYDLTTLITRTHYEETSPETCFINKKFNADFSDITGLDAIMRYIKYNPVTGDEFKNYTTSLIKQKLDLLEGTKVSDRNIYNAEASYMLQYLLKKANDYYDMCVIDVSAGYSPLSQNVIKNMTDLVVVNLNQNINVLDEFFNSKLSVNAKILYIISMYNHVSRVHLNNIMRRYNIKRGDLGAIPYCRAYADYCGTGGAIDFILRNSGVKKGSENFGFINSLRHTAELIINKATHGNTKDNTSSEAGLLPEAEPASHWSGGE